MVKKWKYLLLSMGVIVVGGCHFVWWMLTSITVDDYFLLHQIEDESDLAVAFTVALRKNDPSAYEMIDPALIPRLDEWMNTHRVPECIRRTHIIGGGGSKGIGVYYSCRTRANRGYGILLEVVIEDMTVTDWEVIEENY